MYLFKKNCRYFSTQFMFIILLKINRYVSISCAFTGDEIRFATINYFYFRVQIIYYNI